MSIANAVIQGVTAQVSLRALDRSINELNAARRRFSLIHDLGHHILAEPGANESGMSAVFDGLLILTKAEHDHLADLPSALSGGVLQPGATLSTLPVERQPAPGLPTWNTRLFVGIAAGASFGVDPRAAGQQPANTDAVAFPPPFLSRGLHSACRQASAHCWLTAGPPWFAPSTACSPQSSSCGWSSAPVSDAEPVPTASS